MPKEIITERDIKAKEKEKKRQERIEHTRQMEKDREARNAERSQETLAVELETTKDENGVITCKNVVCVKTGCPKKNMNYVYSHNGGYEGMLYCQGCNGMVDTDNIKDIIGHGKIVEISIKKNKTD